MVECANLEEVRIEIDRIDREIVRLLAERSGYVGQAVRFKRSPEEAAAPARVEAVIARVRRLAAEYGTDPAMVEQLYRGMIARFVAAEHEILAPEEADRPGSAVDGAVSSREEFLR